jgi:hypothetical protein
MHRRRTGLEDKPLSARERASPPAAFYGSGYSPKWGFGENPPWNARQAPPKLITILKVMSLVSFLARKARKHNRVLSFFVHMLRHSVVYG